MAAAAETITLEMTAMKMETARTKDSTYARRLIFVPVWCWRGNILLDTSMMLY